MARAVWIAAGVVALALAGYGAFRIVTYAGQQLANYESRALSTRTVANGGGPASTVFYADGPFESNYSASATATLGKTLDARGWYGVWIALAAYHKRAVTGSAQVGLIRYDRGNYGLRAFVSSIHHGGKARFEDLGPLSDGVHRIALVGGTNGVTASIDGRTIKRLAFDPAADGEGAQLQFGSDVSAPLARGSATIWNMAVKADADATERPFDPVCIYSGSGLSWSRIRDTQMWTASGFYNPNAASTLSHCTRRS